MKHRLDPHEVIRELIDRAKAVQVAVARHVQRNCTYFCSNLGATSLQIARLEPRGPQAALASMTAAASSGVQTQTPQQPAASGRISKEQVGRASWTFLHALAAQYPDKPSRQQIRDVKNLIDILTRMYPCAECAKHFAEIVRASPVRAGSRRELQLWMCEAHNAVNRSIGKPTFNCALVEARWGALDCEEEEKCSLAVGGSRR